MIDLTSLFAETFEVDISNTKKLLLGERGQLIRQKDIIVRHPPTIYSFMLQSRKSKSPLVSFHIGGSIVCHNGCLPDLKSL